VAGDPDAIRKFIRAAEELGYAHVMTFDYVIKASHERREPQLIGPYMGKHTFHCRSDTQHSDTKRRTLAIRHLWSPDEHVLPPGSVAAAVRNPAAIKQPSVG
jgi:hypothetical protein